MRIGAAFLGERWRASWRRPLRAFYFRAIDVARGASRRLRSRLGREEPSLSNVTQYPELASCGRAWEPRLQNRRVVAQSGSPSRGARSVPYISSMGHFRMGHERRASFAFLLALAAAGCIGTIGHAGN